MFKLIYISANGVWLWDPIVYWRKAPGSKEKELRRLGNARFMVSDTGLIRAVSAKMESTQWHSIKNIRIEKSHTNALSFTLSPYMRSGPLNKFRVVNCSLAHLVHCRSVHLKDWKPRMDHWVSVNECPCWKARGSVSVCVWEAERAVTLRNERLWQ